MLLYVTTSLSGCILTESWSPMGQGCWCFWEGAVGRGLTGGTGELPECISETYATYILLRVYYTPTKSLKMGILSDPFCIKCRRDLSVLVPLLWRCSKLHLYWTEVISILNAVFQVSIPTDPKLCVLGVLDSLQLQKFSKEAIAIALFQACRVILTHWKSDTLPTCKEWIVYMGDTLHLEKFIYQQRGCPDKFEKIWVPWLDFPGLSLLDLVTNGLF